jgi:hypothetical protein
MANESYINNGTALLFNGEAGADVAWSMEGDIGAVPRPSKFKWSCEVQFQATPTQGGVLELYVAAAPDHDATQIDGDIGNSDAALGDVDMRRNLMYIGQVVSENAAASEKCVASGVFEFPFRYISLIGYNAAGASINATDSNFRFDLCPYYDQGQ